MFIHNYTMVDLITEQTNKKIRKAVKEALANGGTVPFSLRALLDAGIGLTTIRRVKR